MESDTRPHNMEWSDEEEKKDNAWSPCAYCSGYHKTYRQWDKCSSRCIAEWMREIDAWVAE